MRSLRILGITILLVAGAFNFAVLQNSSHKSEKINGASPEFALIPRTGLPNLYQPSDGIFSGGQPDGEVGFKQLANLGVKTVISVDGARPDIALAAQHDLTYVHLPHGYDGIEPEHAVKLAKAVRSLDGPVYIHCHHGKHRSPAAAAIAGIGLGLMEPESAIRFLEHAGTSSHYQGLYRSVSDSKPVSDEILNQPCEAFPSVAAPTPIVESMIAIEEHLHSLSKLTEQNGFAPSDSPDLDVTQKALLLSELFTELVRTEHEYGEAYSNLMKQSQRRSSQLYRLLSNQSRSMFPNEEISKSIKQLREDCRSCHREFRD